MIYDSDYNNEKSTNAPTVDAKEMAGSILTSAPESIIQWLFFPPNYTLPGSMSDLLNQNFLVLEFPLWCSRLRTRHSVHEDVRSVPGLTQWVKDLAV